jgi:hypothetical protein
MQKNIPTKAVNRLKELAKNLKRQSKLSHTEALDKIAEDHNFVNWHHVIELYRPYQYAEHAFKDGCVIAVEWGNEESLSLNEIFIQDELLEVVCEDHLVRWHLGCPNYDDPELRSYGNSLDIVEQQEFLQDSFQPLSWFRINEKFWNKSEVEILDLVHEATFFMPELTIIKSNPIWSASLQFDSTPPTKGEVQVW